MIGNPITLLEQIVGPRFVHRTQMPNVVQLCGGTLSHQFHETKKLAFIVELRQRYSQMYLHLDAMDKDILEDFEGHWGLVSDCLYHIPLEQDALSLYEQLYRGNWVLLFRNQGIGQDWRLPDGIGRPDVMAEFSLGSEGQIAVASWPDDVGWTVGWSRDQG